MSAAFEAALAAMVADANMASAALLRPGGNGVGIAMRVILSAPDAVGNGFGQEVIAADARIVVRKADYPAPAKGDTIEIDATLYTVRAWREDAERVSWTLEATR